MTTRSQLRTLRDVTVAVLHPDDEDGRVIRDQLSRIGCRTETGWPPPRGFDMVPDVAFVSVERDQQAAVLRLLRRSEGPQPAVIAVVDYENPAMLQLVLELDALAVVNKPVRSIGILTSLVIARSQRQRTEDLLARIRRLEARLSGFKNIDKAKKVLMEIQGIDEGAAYRIMRAQAMTKRISLEEMATAILNAHALLNSTIDDA
jgi:AmiR/NasT family two-component response regulator